MQGQAIGRELLGWTAGHKDVMVAALLGLVEMETPSGDKARLDLLAGRLVERFHAAGAAAERLSGPCGDHVRVEWPAPEAAGPPVLVLCHFDTVWPVGTLKNMPPHTDGTRAYGPGIYDMKASLIQFEYALRAAGALGLTPRRPVVALLTSDEEVGSNTSRALIETEAAGACCVLVLEPPLADGRLKTARKGVGHYELTVNGRAAHAGVEPEKGASAIVELAHQVLAIDALNDPARGTTINVGLIHGGTASNVVAARAEATIDVRVTSAEAAARVDRALHALQPVLSGTSLTLDGGLNRPPMVPTERTAALFRAVQRIGRTLGLELGEGSTGGGSDGNFTAALGVPTLDGLGCRGDGAHATHEHILVDSLPERAALLAAVLCLLPESFDD